jgi:hypothetical protein
MPESTRLLCTVCSDPVDPETAHRPHTPDCAKSRKAPPPGEPCTCDLVVHPECCPELECQDITNGYTITLTASFSVPPWFSTNQARELARALVEHTTQTEHSFYEGFGPASDAATDDLPYICAAQADTRIDAGDAGGVFATPVVVWGHSDRCRSCHHAGHAVAATERCPVEGCDCTHPMPYGPLPEIGGSR